MSENKIIEVDNLEYTVSDNNLYLVYLYKDKLANNTFHFKEYDDIRHFKDGLLHNEIGPAFIRNDLICWFLNGIRFYSEAEWFDALTHEQKHEAVWNLKKP